MLASFGFGGHFGGGGGGFMMMNTNTGNIIITNLMPLLTSIEKTSNLKVRINNFLTITLTLHRNDAWIHDNEEWGKGANLDEVIMMLGKGT